MALRIDHISISSPNIFRSADTLCKETGLGYFSGEWWRHSGVQIFPCGAPGQFIEIGGIVDVHTLKKMDEYKQWSLDVTAKGDHFNGLCLGVDSMEELEVFAKHFGSKINDPHDPDPSAHFQRADGYLIPMTSVPVGGRFVWLKGLPNVYYYPDRLRHSSGVPVHPCEDMVRPTGFKWVEVGGTEEQMATWLGIPNPGETLKMRFNGKSLGVWAVCVGAEGKDDIVIRRPPASVPVPVSKFAD